MPVRYSYRSGLSGMYAVSDLHRTGFSFTELPSMKISPSSKPRMPVSAQGGRFARAVLPDEPVNVARAHVERQIVHRHFRAVALGEVLDFQNFVVHKISCLSPPLYRQAVSPIILSYARPIVNRIEQNHACPQSAQCRLMFTPAAGRFYRLIQSLFCVERRSFCNKFASLFISCPFRRCRRKYTIMGYFNYTKMV